MGAEVDVSGVEGTRIIDADAHVAIPPELYAERLPARLRARAPRMLTLEGGRHFWLIEGRLAPKPIGRGAGTPNGFNGEGLGAQDYQLSNIPGRLADMDREGVWAQVLYPDLILVNPGIEDPEVAAEVARIYNDHAAERTAAAPERLLRVAVVALQDAAEAARELRRCVVELGCVGAVIPALVGDRLLNHRDFEPFFEEAERLGTPIAVHGVNGVYDVPWQDLFETYFGSRLVSVPMQYMVALGSVFEGQMLERYPSLRWGFFEAGGIGWVPYWIGRLDEHLARRERSAVPASEYVAQGRLVFSCEPDEMDLAETARAVGDHCILYASDYPHGDSKWPHTVDALRAIPGLSEESQERILGGNAARFYTRLTVAA
jgi:predicted TIM-barrel fold metal-dependent hydrolase